MSKADEQAQVLADALQELGYQATSRGPIVGVYKNGDWRGLLRVSRQGEISIGEEVKTGELERALEKLGVGKYVTSAAAETKLITNIRLEGRRWFNRSQGNTYHSVEIFIDDELVHKIPFAYGYGDQYETTAIQWLVKNGILPKQSAHEAEYLVPWRWKEQLRKEYGIDLTSSVIDVPRKRDLDL